MFFFYLTFLHRKKEITKTRQGKNERADKVREMGVGRGIR
jgi:long-subunit acyl-CoA synthetase (AMP-forming)